jgi:hypothetical protein
MLAHVTLDFGENGTEEADGHAGMVVDLSFAPD